MKTHPPHRFAHCPLERQRGVVLLFSLIALVVMLIASVALIRSFQSSLFTSGNIAFKRDLQNQGERAVDEVLKAFRTGDLKTPAARAAHQAASNYSATMLPVNAKGIPNALQNDTTFAAVGDALNDIKPANQQVSVRYVIDRLCVTIGAESTLGPTSCVVADNLVPAGTSSGNWQSAERSLGVGGGTPTGQPGVVYRLSIKVTGPRNTQSFFQSTFTVPSSL